MQMDVGMMGCLDLWAIVPELILAGLALLLVPVAGLARGLWQQVPTMVAALGLVAALGFTARMLLWPEQAVFCETYAVDGFGTVFKLLILLGALISLMAIASHFRGTVQAAHAPVALLFSTVGGVLLVSSLDLGLIVLFLQMLSMGSYILVSLVRRDRRANEATMKFFIYAAVALAVMAYGLSFLFGLTGSLELRAIGQALTGADPVWVAVAFGLVVIGYAFEVTAVPFHFWAPDVYDGATAPVAGFLSVVPKIAGFGALLRFLLLALPDGLAAWPLVIAVLAALTMTLGNLVALRQTHLKRLLAYSSIAQAGYVLMVVAVAGRADSALSAAGFYLAAYLFMNLGAFVVTAQLETEDPVHILVPRRDEEHRCPIPRRPQSPAQVEAIDVRQRPDQRAEALNPLAMPAVDVLAQQRDLAHAARHEVAGFRQDALGRAADLGAAGIGNDTEGAELVAALLHGQEGRGRAACGGALRQVVELVLGREVGVHGGRLAPRHGGQAVIGLRPHDKVHQRHPADDLVPLGLGHAARDTDLEVRPLGLERLQAPEVGIELFGRLLADVAGVQQHHVRVLGAVRLDIAFRAHGLGHALAVIDVHLAAVGLDEKLLRCRGLGLVRHAALSLRLRR